jgi:hypothetical protein
VKNKRRDILKGISFATLGATGVGTGLIGVAEAKAPQGALAAIVPDRGLLKLAEWPEDEKLIAVHKLGGQFILFSQRCCFSIDEHEVLRRIADPRA